MCILFKYVFESKQANIIASFNIGRGEPLKNSQTIISLFQYIKELHSLKYKVVTNIEEQIWYLRLDNLPDDPEHVIQYYRDRTDDNEDLESESEDEMLYESSLMEVKKPSFESCPQVPRSLIKWLEPGWGDFHSGVELNDREKFFVSKIRSRNYNQWIAERDKWVQSQKLKEKTLHFFNKLYSIYTDLERDSEIIELVVGNGFLEVKENCKIKHPTLLKRLRMKFDAEENSIKICDTDLESQLYTMMMQQVEGINYAILGELQADLKENDCHPLDRNEAPKFLKRLSNKLSAQSQYMETENEPITPDSRVFIKWSPSYLLRNKEDGTLKAIDSVVEKIENTGYVPGFLNDLIEPEPVKIYEQHEELSIDQQLAETSGEDTDILLSKPANKEQLEIARRIESYNAVLVQGPPGTGKTHTIANLIGHFLAQGKSVLVTSHTSKALSVLKDKLEPEIQSLCVSILRDSNKDMNRSIDDITAHLGSYTTFDLNKKIDSINKDRNRIIKSLAETRKRIFAIKHSEIEPIIYNGENYSPKDAARFVSDGKEQLSYIPGRVTPKHVLPLTFAELQQLYNSNAELSREDEEELMRNLPDPETFITPHMFEENIEAEKASSKDFLEVCSELEMNLNRDYESNCINILKDSETIKLIDQPTTDGMDQLEESIVRFTNVKEWMIQAAVDGNKGKQFRQRWELLISHIEDCNHFAGSVVLNLMGKKITIKSDLPQQRLIKQVQFLQKIYLKGRKPKKFDFFRNRDLENILDEITVNEHELRSEEDCQAVINYIYLKEKRSYLGNLWDSLMAKSGEPQYSSLGDRPEEICKNHVPLITQYLNLHSDWYVPLYKQTKMSGINSNILFEENPYDTDLDRTKKILQIIDKKLPLLIRVARSFIKDQEIRQEREKSIAVLSTESLKPSHICNELVDNLHLLDCNQYKKNYQKYTRLYDKYSSQQLRKELLDRLRISAFEWAAAIEQRDGIHGYPHCPDSIEDAWKWKQLTVIIQEIASESIEDLTKKSVDLSENYRKKTAELAATKAWYNLHRKVENKPQMRQDLIGWKQTVKKIGKGTGKNAPRYRRKARELMANCQEAVPAWIMPVSKALESLNPTKNSFDVIIIDEASQSDLAAMAILYMGKKVIIVGDDQQVSPMAVGLEIAQMNSLQTQYIKNRIPNWHLYEAKTSIYDIGLTTYQPLMLREHFRCVPDIIGYSNRLSYDYKIKPLRDKSSSPIERSVISYRVDGRRLPARKVNELEAKTIVALMMACIEQPEYHKETFGVISLLGDSQSKLIQQEIILRIDPRDIEKRRIISGNSSSFQGDERGVIFLSLVDSNESEGTLHKVGFGQNESTKQRYNVAASRAKNQLWIVHSLDKSKDLKNGDMRKDLLVYADNPRAFAEQAKVVEAKAESSFEEEVAKSLVASGYHIKQQWEVGSYRIDMVAIYKGKKIAIECDGERWHSGVEQVKQDMERQTILERMGWKFIRIRGSEFYYNKKETIERVKRDLDEYGIKPENIIKDSDDKEDLLLDKVKIRAGQILDNWHQQDELKQSKWQEKQSIYDDEPSQYSDYREIGIRTPKIRESATE